MSLTLPTATRPTQAWIQAAVQALADPQKPLPVLAKDLARPEHARFFLVDLAASEPAWKAALAQSPTTDRHLAVWAQAEPVLKHLATRQSDWIQSGKTPLIRDQTDVGVLVAWLSAWEALGYGATHFPDAQAGTFPKVQDGATTPWCMAILHRIDTWMVKHWTAMRSDPEVAALAVHWIHALDSLMQRVPPSETSPNEKRGWYRYAQWTLMTLIAGHDTPTDALRQVAERHALGWPKRWGGTEVAVWDQPLLLSVPNQPDKSAWQGAAERLHHLVIEARLREEPPKRMPGWAIWLDALWQRRQAQPADAFPDPQGHEGWARWRQVYYQHYAQTLTKPTANPPPEADAQTLRAYYAQLQNRFAQHCDDQAQRWRAAFREWLLEGLPTTPTDPQAAAAGGRPRLRQRS